MKKLYYLVLSALLVLSCGKSSVPNMNLLGDNLTFTNEAGTQQISLSTNQDWTATPSASWITVSPASGSGSSNYQSISVSVAENQEEGDRNGTVLIRGGELSKTVQVSQAGTPRFTIAEFRSKKADEVTWYKLSGEIAAIENEEYGNFFIVDDTGYIYVYGLCETKQAKGGNDQSFPKLGLKVGDTVTMMTLRAEYNKVPQAGGQTPAYFVSKTAGEYRMGRKQTSTTDKWLELPATSATDGHDILMHGFPDFKERSYAAYWDYEHLVALWVAYPLHAGNIGNGERTDKFCLNPLLPRNKQPYLAKAFKTEDGTGYDRGHQIPSADRLNYRVNFETFFSTNMTPQNGDLNSGIWGTTESKLRSWAKNKDTDTLYVVTGCVVKGSTKYALDNDGKHVTVPTGYYKAVLRLDKSKNYSAIGLYFDNAPNKATSIPWADKSMVMSIDALEEKVGVDFFVNLPDNVEASVEAQDPATVAWWKNN